LFFKNRLRLLATAALFFLSLNPVCAQQDSVRPADSLALKEKPAYDIPAKVIPPEHSPKKAAAYSACLPGLGQAYNHKYWKIPLIYVAGTGLGYFFWYEQHQFDFFTKAYHQSVAGSISQIDPSVRNLSTDYLLTEKNYFNRYRDLSVIGLTALYILNIVDATVDAHLWHFDQKINDDLGMKISPALVPAYGQLTPLPGLRMSLSFR
jgi:hypothetical protein